MIEADLASVPDPQMRCLSRGEALLTAADNGTRLTTNGSKDRSRETRRRWLQLAQTRSRVARLRSRQLAAAQHRDRKAACRRAKAPDGCAHSIPLVTDSESRRAISVCRALTRSDCSSASKPPTRLYKRVATAGTGSRCCKSKQRLLPSQPKPKIPRWQRSWFPHHTDGNSWSGARFCSGSVCAEAGVVGFVVVEAGGKLLVTGGVGAVAEFDTATGVGGGSCAGTTDSVRCGSALRFCGRAKQRRGQLDLFASQPKLRGLDRRRLLADHLRTWQKRPACLHQETVSATAQTARARNAAWAEVSATTA